MALFALLCILLFGTCTAQQFQENNQSNAIESSPTNASIPSSNTLTTPPSEPIGTLPNPTTQATPTALRSDTNVNKSTPESPLPLQVKPAETKPTIITYPADSHFSVCPVVAEFQHEKDDIPLSEKKAEIKDQLMTSFVLAHPSLTLWDYFKLENQKDQADFMLLPASEQRKRVILGILDFATNTVIDLAKFAVAAFAWFVKLLRHPAVGYLEVHDFFVEFKQNCVVLANMFKLHPKKTTKDLVGGFMLNIKHHPEEFTAESVLLLTGGMAVIHGLIGVAESLFAGVSSAVTNTILSVLVFIHIIDDPILIVMPILKRAVGTAQAIQGDPASPNAAITYDPIAPLPTCKIPPQSRMRFSTRDLCIARVERVRVALFGTMKRLAQMTKYERVEAYKRMHDIICCYIPSNTFEVSVPKMVNGMPTGEMVNQAIMMQKCDQLQGTYPFEPPFNP
uniref:Uncharacterized protein AlNc14C35G3152 n=1 Tax=Albugo laibachii Nc14 TaxID=890382 RepID=F0W8M7_9STRA|nr:conserved hypothetical protein [Albugo laibachii Nc14]|eukprot:CCA17483.1 conserved hypothetical protein [Albugo laibachii Nc14]